MLGRRLTRILWSTALVVGLGGCPCQRPSLTSNDVSGWSCWCERRPNCEQCASEEGCVWCGSSCAHQPAGTAAADACGEGALVVTTPGECPGAGGA